MRNLGLRSGLSKPGRNAAQARGGPNGSRANTGLGRVATRLRESVGPGSRLSTRVSGPGGGRGKDDRGLYVSTGGITQEARYEAERAEIPVTLIDLDGTAELVVQHYESMDGDGRAMVPLQRICWPIR